MGAINCTLRKKNGHGHGGNDSPCRTSQNSEELKRLCCKMERLTTAANFFHQVPVSPCSSGVDLSFPNLAEEVILEIFKFLPTRDLLRTCRLVSNQWRRIASEMCRRRLVFVELRSTDGEHARNPDDILDRFTMETLPWSSICFYTGKLGAVKQFINSYGEHLSRLFLKFGDDGPQEIISLFQKTPNLRHLAIWDSSTKESTAWVTEKSFGEVSLRRLTHLEIVRSKRLGEDPEVDNYEMNHLELLKYLVLNCGAKLEHFDVGFHPETIDAAQVAFSLLPNLRSMSIKIDADLLIFNYFVSKMETITLSGLCVQLSDVNEATGDPSDYTPVETFLTAHFEQLEKLDIELRVRSGMHPLPFKFPALPQLDRLGIEFGNDGVLHQDFTNAFLCLFDVDLFPVLREVTFTGSGDWTEDNNNRFFPSDFSCQSVTDFTTRLQYPVRDDWSRVFPNLTSLDCDVVYSEDEDLLRIFSLRKLRLLTLHLEPVGDVDPNKLFSGFDNPDQICIFQATDAEIAEERLAQGRASVLQLTELRKLDVDFNGICLDDVKMFTDAGADLSLLQLQPLCQLLISHTSISKECAARLNERHWNFVLEA